jgi:hypothetical protein
MVDSVKTIVIVIAIAIAIAIADVHALLWMNWR